MGPDPELFVRGTPTTRTRPRRVRRRPEAVDADRAEFQSQLAEAGLRVAPLRPRLLAWLLDVALFLVPAAGVTYLTGGVALIVRVARSTIGKELGILGGAGALPGSDLLGAHTALVEVLALVGVVVGFGAAWVAVRIGATARFGRTPGKWLLGLRVVDATNLAAPPRLGKAALRWLVPQMSGAVPLPGTGVVVYLPALRDPWRRGLHDRAAGTIVVRTAPCP